MEGETRPLSVSPRTLGIREESMARENRPNIHDQARDRLPFDPTSSRPATLPIVPRGLPSADIVVSEFNGQAKVTFI